MQGNTNHTLIQVVLVLVVIAIGYYVFSDSEEDVVEKPRPALIAEGKQAERQAVKAEEMEASPIEVLENGTSRSSSKRIKTVPTSAVRSYKADEAELIETNFADEYEAETALESALSGNIDHAIAISEIGLQCRAGFDNEKVVQNNLNRMSKTAKLGKPLPGLFMPGTGNTQNFNNIAEYESFMWDRYAQCQTFRGMSDKNLRERLAQMAEAGNVNARYLFAMWVPTQSGTSNGDLVSWMNYQSLAMDFTWQNIREGESLGLLAYGRSLEQSGHIYFTPRHMRYGPAFILASHKCGLDNSVVNQKVGNLTGHWKRRSMTQAMNTAESMSDLIVKQFCH